jgi:hypothetical protein
VKKMDVLNVDAWAGAYLMNKKFQGSWISTLQAAYPNYEWHDWKFNKYYHRFSESSWEYSRLSSKFWEDSGSRVRYVKWLEGELSIKNPEDWYGITAQQVELNGGQMLLKQTGNAIRYECFVL